MSYVTPVVAFFAYCLGYTQNAWDYNAEMCLYILNTKLINVTKPPRSVIADGVILTNHRCWADFYIDAYLFSCPSIARRVGVFATGFFGMLAVLCNRMIIINRTQDRNTIFSYIKKQGKKLFLFYPEGTRCSHLTLPDDVSLKCGILKSIWENPDNTRIQIIISKNKENVMNEKKFTIGYGINVYYVVGEPIYTRDYDTFDLFIAKIKLDWRLLWNSGNLRFPEPLPCSGNQAM